MSIAVTRLNAKLQRGRLRRLTLGSCNRLVQRDDGSRRSTCTNLKVFGATQNIENSISCRPIRLMKNMKFCYADWDFAFRSISGSQLMHAIVFLNFARRCDHACRSIELFRQNHLGELLLDQGRTD